VNCRRCSDNTWQTFVLFEQVSGLDAATADLYAAAAAIVNDTTTASQTLARKRRLLKEAQVRLV
jgi:hypothetical protein